jgi:hypothetical protein
VGHPRRHQRVARARPSCAAQAALIDQLIDDIDERDQVMVVAFDATHRRFGTWQDAMAIDRRALAAFLAKDAGLGETDLGEALAGAVSCSTVSPATWSTWATAPPPASAARSTSCATRSPAAPRSSAWASATARTSRPWARWPTPPAGSRPRSISATIWRGDRSIWWRPCTPRGSPA